MADKRKTDADRLQEFANELARHGANVDVALGRSVEAGEWHFEPAERIAEGVYGRRGTGTTGDYQVRFAAIFVNDAPWPAAPYGGENIGAKTRATISGGKLPGEVEIVLGVSSGDAPRLYVEELTVRSAATPLTTVGLRSVSPTELLRVALAVIWGHPEIPQVPQPTSTHRGQGRILDDEALAEVARIYRSNPGRGYLAVKEHFHIGRSTAGDYITRARDAGHKMKD